MSTSGGNEQSVFVDQTKPLPAGSNFRRIATVKLSATGQTTVRLSNDGATGFVILDALQFVPMPSGE
ncbi:MAG: hypothetical protein Aurels2KO_31500 [Aureliella sp.]